MKMIIICIIFLTPLNPVPIIAPQVNMIFICMYI